MDLHLQLLVTSSSFPTKWSAVVIECQKVTAQNVPTASRLELYQLVLDITNNTPCLSDSNIHGKETRYSAHVLPVP